MRLAAKALTASLLFAAFYFGTAATYAQYSSPELGKGDASEGTPSVSARELRRMTAEQFQAGIDKEGAKAFTQRLTRENGHNWDEPNYDIILNHISTGEAAWLKIAAEIGPYTVAPYSMDPNFNNGLNVALAYALLENPTGVLRMRKAVGNEDEHFMNACMYPFHQPSQAFIHRYQGHALLALKRVKDPSLRAQAEDCRKELLSPPTEKASN
jgi:hypothetical protein